MTACTDLAEHLEATLQLVLVIGPEYAGKAPALALDMWGCVGILRRMHRQCNKACHGSDSGDDELGFEHVYRPDHACALPRTLSEMLVGSGFGVSMRESTGSTTRKYMK